MLELRMGFAVSRFWRRLGISEALGLIGKHSDSICLDRVAFSVAVYVVFGAGFLVSAAVGLRMVLVRSVPSIWAYLVCECVWSNALQQASSLSKKI